MNKNKKGFIEYNGVVIETLPGSKFLIELDEVNAKVTAYLSGQMRRFNINVLLGDKVKVEFSEYDPKTGRITYRYNK